MAEPLSWIAIRDQLTKLPGSAVVRIIDGSRTHFARGLVHHGSDVVILDAPEGITVVALEQQLDDELGTLEEDAKAIVPAPPTTPLQKTRTLPIVEVRGPKPEGPEQYVDLVLRTTELRTSGMPEKRRLVYPN